MIVTLPPEAAMALVAVRWCASTDKQRPLLNGILLEWNVDEDSGRTDRTEARPVITATATDSYILGHRKVYSLEVSVEDGDEPTGSVLVDAVELFNAVTNLAGRKVDQQVVLFLESRSGGAGNPVNNGSVTVSNAAATTAVTLKGLDGAPFQYRTLANFDRPVMPTASDIRLVAGVGLDPERIAKVIKGGWMKRPAKLDFNVAVIIRPSQAKPDKDPALAPWYVGYDEAKIGSYIGIVMPVRLDGMPNASEVELTDHSKGEVDEAA